MVPDVPFDGAVVESLSRRDRLGVEVTGDLKEIISVINFPNYL